MLQRFCYLLVFFLLSFQFIFSQSSMLDVIYLKNGSIIKGEILEITRERIIKIQTTDNKTWSFHLEEVDRVVKEPGQRISLTNTYLNAGFINYSSLGLLVGDESATHQAPFSITMTNGYIFASKISVGAGFGLEFLDRTSIPLFADLRYYLTKNKLSPYFMFQGGYSFPIEDEHDEYYQERNNIGGYMVNPGIGFLLNFQSGGALQFNVGYRNQLLRYEYNDAFDTELKQYYNRFNIRFGLIFR